MRNEVCIEINHVIGIVAVSGDTFPDFKKFASDNSANWESNDKRWVFDIKISNLVIDEVMETHAIDTCDEDDIELIRLHEWFPNEDNKTFRIEKSVLFSKE